MLSHHDDTDVHSALYFLLQFYTDKTLCNDKTEVHAFKVGLLNAEYNAKNKHLGTLALIPVLKPKAGISDRQLNEARRDLMFQAVSTNLASLKAASFTGMEIRLADGVTHTVYPRALSYVADDPEQHAVSQILSGQTKRQCVRCYITSDKLAAVELSAKHRSLELQQQIRKRIAEKYTISKKAGDQERSEYGTYPDGCGLFGFDGEDHESCKQQYSDACSVFCIPSHLNNASW